MTRNDEFTGQLESYLESYEGSTPLPEAVRDAISAALPSTHQRPAWWPARRLPTMNNTTRLALATAAVAVAAVVGYSYFSGGNVGSPGIDVPSPTLEATPAALRLSEGPIEAGRYTLGGDFPVPTTFDVPAQWIACSTSVMEQGVCRLAGREFPRIGLTFNYVENVAADPCGQELHDPPIGPTVDDIVTAVSNLEGFEATAPEDVTIDGYAAKRFTLTAPTNPPCDLLATWVTPTRVNGMGASEINLLHVVDVDGVRLLLSSAYFENTTTPEDFAALDELISSIDFAP
jgi:hypothetical protein